MFFLRDKLLGGLYAGVLFLVEVVEALDDAVVAASFEPYWAALTMFWKME